MQARGQNPGGRARAPRGLGDFSQPPTLGVHKAGADGCYPGTPPSCPPAGDAAPGQNNLGKGLIGPSPPLTPKSCSYFLIEMKLLSYRRGLA